MHVFNFLSFKFVVFIVIETAFQKTNNVYKLGSFNHWFSIWKSFLDTKEKILLVPLQKRPSYLDLKMLVKVDCALITMSSRGLFKSLLPKCYSNKKFTYTYQYFRKIILNRHNIFWWSLSSSQVIWIETFQADQRNI